MTDQLQDVKAPACGQSGSTDGLAPSRIVCAAIRAYDGEVLLGIRHYSPDMLAQMRARPTGNKFSHRYGVDQGFVDQHGNYFTRAEAYRIASDARQVIRPEACLGYELCSEGLY